ncbi:MAG: Na+ dependent nucleoside transporter [Flavobacteriia bacterium]|nr:Na+ dependent nucleoside transporter [Flavobacteriia bacterium]
MRFKIIALILLLLTTTIFVVGVFVTEEPQSSPTLSQDILPVEGRYSFYSITNKADSSLLSIGKKDSILLKSDSTFAYFLASKNNLYAEGTWVKTGEMLTFNYTLPSDTTRYYSIIELSDTALVFSEGNVVFSFRRPKYKPPFIQNSDIDFSFSLNHIGRGMMGMFLLVTVGFIFSTNRKKIRWGQIGVGLLLQLLIAYGILHVGWVQSMFEGVSKLFVEILGFTREGSLFLFGSLIEDEASFGYIFAFQVLPTVIFFSALTSLFYYYGILQKVVYVFAWVMRNTMRLSGAESLAAAGNIFLGQTEAPLLVKPYIAGMTKSELLCLMSGGMATIAGGVLAAFIGFLGGGNEAQELYFANHLLAASVMSAPAAIIAAKLLVPETKEVNRDMHISKATIGKSWLEAIANGTTEGLKLAVNVGAMLLVFTAFIYGFNAILSDVIGANTGLNEWAASISDGRYDSFSLQFILGYALSPLTWLMGVDGSDIYAVGQLLGEKTILNEFYAYTSMSEMLQEGQFIHKRSAMIATYILCGFANFASIGIQIGGIGALAPSRKSELSKLGLRALLAGTMASLFTAVLVGMLT